MTSAQTLAAAGLWTQTWPLAAAYTWPQMAVQSTQISMAPRQYVPQSPTWPQGISQSQDICVAFGGGMDHGPQQRPQLQ